MATVHKSLAELRDEPFSFSPDDRARLDAMTEEEIIRAAEADPDNPPWTDEELARGRFARDVRRARKRVGQSQEAFAATLELPVATLRNWEQGRFNPDPAARALIKLVSRDPEHALKVLAE
jgi:putative transcriptional regulator